MKTVFGKAVALFLHLSFYLALATGVQGAEAPSVSIEQLLERGEELYNQPPSCWVCHGEEAEGRIGPALTFGPSPADIYEQLLNTPQMGVINQELNPSDEDLVAIAAYIRSLSELPLSNELIAEFRSGLTARKMVQTAEIDFVLTDRDRAVQEIESFDSVLEDWQRRSHTGNIGRNYEVTELATFDAGEARFSPQPGGLYFYENLGNSANLSVLDGVSRNAASSQITVGDANTKQIIASYELPVELKSAIHTTVMSPDGKYVYTTGPKPSGPDIQQSPWSPATLLKADALTLQPVKQLAIGSRLHHGQLFRDEYLLIDTFARDVDGLNIFLFDPESDTIIGGVRDEELGGKAYTAYTDDEFIYVLMEPPGYGPGSSGNVGATNMNLGRLVAMRPFWIAKIDPESWEVVQEYPFPGYRGDWIVIDSSKTHLYVTSAGSSTVSKINLQSGEIVWTGAAGSGPYGATLTADESEIWVANKGETTGWFGRTITVMDASTGRPLDTLFSGYEVDHILLAPNGKEIWATSNGEGRIYVFDTQTREQTHVIDMPQNGDPHGLVWVHYDDEGNSRVVRDQGGFRGGVNPALGRSLQ